MGTDRGAFRTPKRKNSGKARGAEVNLRKLDADTKEKFRASDTTEWEAIVGTKAVRIVRADQAHKIRRTHADRILSSRMVRRLKPQPGIDVPPKAKSRWCVRGYEDPDTEEMQVYAPTPQTESLMMMLQIVASLGWDLTLADAKNAFCQSDRLRREAGPIYVEPCEGLPLGPGELIELVAPVYGLNDAPVLWHRTLTTWLAEQGFEKSLLEPCLWVLRGTSHLPKAAILIEVDDLLIGASAKDTAILKEKLTSRFTFGK